ncbi:kinesin-like protein KIF21A isoform X2 [Periplaneta americana]|uniref:kinesin-like protein KIF21A isoform X2 n=1 Tax=Periplaneta americana TaxID=6978 RepID=UPI0037E7059E
MMNYTLEPVVVAVRIRPLAAKEYKENTFSVVQQLSHEPKVLCAAGKGYAFDHIFTEDDDQKTVYTESVRPAVKKLCAGFNCAVIAYGQTGTGKTYTMGTDPKSCEKKSAGIISRAIEDILSEANGKDSDVSVEISFMEIYNEEVYDLLTHQQTKLVVQAFNVQNLTHVSITSCEQALHQLEFGSSNRHTRATKVNVHSSRSHAIFTVHYKQKMGNQTILSRFDLVDLAGLEGVRHTGNQGVALHEANNINRGLLNLRNVISILSNNSKDYISYRTTTLTTVLKDSLSRESYVMMIACISPSNLDIAQTITTLRFAEDAKKVMSKPKINQIICEYKASNPHSFDYLNDVTPLIPPTPSVRNLYKVTSTPAAHFRKPYMQHNISNQTNSSSADIQDFFKKPVIYPLTESPNISVSLSEISTSTALDISSALSPIVRKHMAQMEERLGEKISTVLREQLRKPSTYGTESLHNFSHHSSPVQQTVNENDRDVQPFFHEKNILSIRNDFKELVDDLKTYIRDEIAPQSAVQKLQDNATTHHKKDDSHPLKNIRCRLPFEGDDDTSKSNSTDLDYQELNWRQVSVSDGENSVSFTQQNTVRRVTRRSSRIAQNSILPLTFTDQAPRNSVHATETETSGLYNHNSTSQDDELTYSLSNISTVRRSRRISRIRKDDAGCLSTYSPSIVTTVRRSKRLSLKLQTQDEFHKMVPLRTSTVRRSMRLSRTSTRDTDTTKLSPSNVLGTGGRRRRSARLMGKPPTYSDETVERLSSLRKVQRLSFKPALMISPVPEFGVESSQNAREKFRQKALKLLNGTVRDLTNLSTVGPKTAIVIYNYRILNNIQFTKLEDLKDIPGLPKTYYERFVKANNLF